MSEELGIRPDFADDLIRGRHASRFKYYSTYEELAEHEMDHALVYYLNVTLKSRIEINTNEVAEIWRVFREKLDGWLSHASADFSTWFAEVYALVKTKKSDAI